MHGRLDVALDRAAVPAGRGRAARPLPRRAARGRLARRGRAAARRRRRARRRRGARRRATGSRAGSSVELTVPEAAPSGLEPEEVPLRIAYEDEHLLVVDKPAGVVVHPAPGHAAGTLVHGLRRRGAAGGEDEERPGIVHRLDRDTSGLLVVARTEEALRAPAGARPRPGARAAVPRARPRPPALADRAGSRRRSAATASDPTRHSLDTDTPREAITHFEVERAAPPPRAAARAARDGPHAPDPRPPRGDRPAGRRRYASTASRTSSGSSASSSTRARLAFPHPFTGERVEVESPLPAELQAALARFAS